MQIADKVKKTCGLVMPISAIESCDANHWMEVRSILTETAQSAGLDCKLVSEEAAVGVIHKRIVANLLENDLVICDVSCKNPNVMFELGMRLAFDKPVIVIKDDVTPYSFDSSPIEHVVYRRDLRFSSIVDFRKQLSEKIIATLNSSNTYSFLSSFGISPSFKHNPPLADVNSEILRELKFLSGKLQQLHPTDGFKKNENLDARGRKNLYVSSMILHANKQMIEILCTGLQDDVSVFFKALGALVGVKEVIKGKHGSFDKAELMIEPTVAIEHLFYQLQFTIRPNQVLFK